MIQVDEWKPEILYKLGTVVMYRDAPYKVIQEHRSQADWPPSPHTQALWTKLPQDGRYCLQGPAGNAYPVVFPPQRI